MGSPNQTHNHMLPRKDAASLLQRELDFNSSCFSTGFYGLGFTMLDSGSMQSPESKHL